MYFEWMLVVTMLLPGGDAIPVIMKTYDNSLECKSAMDLLESAGALVDCIETKSDKHPI